MNWWRGFVSRIECDAPIGQCTWFRLGGSARFLCRPRDAADLAAIVRRARQECIPVKVLGRGANVLVSDDGFDGVVVRLDSDAFRGTCRQGTLLDVGAGVNVMQLARSCCEWGLSGLEGMAGIPATVGGAVRMNAGGQFGEFGRVVHDIQVLDHDGRIETWPHERIGFTYRGSGLGDRIVLSARLELGEEDPEVLKARYAENFAFKTKTQPLTERTAGCIFKNPPGVSAGALIDQAGLKGAHCGGAFVSTRHANFVVARCGATASDVLNLIDVIRGRVDREFGAHLELEVEVWDRESVV